jgi:hypothetical protein
LGLTFNVKWLDLLINISFIPSQYIGYIINGSQMGQRPFVLLMTKYVFIPFYFLAIIYIVGRNKLTNKESRLFFTGFISFCLRLIGLAIPLVSRVTEIFILFSIFPLYFYFREILKRKEYLNFSLSVLALLFMYFLKTMLITEAGNEYFYQSIYFLGRSVF